MYHRKRQTVSTYAREKKTPITTLVSVQDTEQCKKNGWKYNFVFKKGLEMLNNTQREVEELRSDNEKLVATLQDVRVRLFKLENPDYGVVDVIKKKNRG
jgi:hypothetical protein